MTQTANNDNSRTLAGRLDDLDRGVLLRLQLDGRQSYRSIAQSLGVPEATVRFRAQRMQREGILRIVGFVDPARLGQGVLANVLLRVSPGKRREVIEALKEWPEIMYLATCAGRYDVWVQAFCEDTEALDRLLTDRLAELPLLESEVVPELQVHKASYVYAGLGAVSPENDS